MLNIVWGNINSKMHYGGKRSVLKPRETRTKKEKFIIVVKSIVAAQFLFHDTVAIHRTLPELRCAKRTTGRNFSSDVSIRPPVQTVGVESWT